MSETSTTEQTKPQTFDDPDAGDVHVDAPMGAVGPIAALNKMRGRLKGKLRHGRTLTHDDIDEAHKHARLHTTAPTQAAEAEITPFPDDEPHEDDETAPEGYGELVSGDLAELCSLNGASRLFIELRGAA